MVLTLEAAHLASQAGESALILGVKSRGGARSAAGGTATGSTTGLTTAAGTTTGAATGAATAATLGTVAALGAVAAALTTTATTAAAEAAAGALGLLNEALVDLDDLLDLALTLALGLAGGTGNELVVLVLDQGLGRGPLLVGLGALVGLADRQSALEAQLLLGLLGEVLVVGNELLLGLGLLLSGGLLSGGSLLVGLGNGLASLLVALLGLTLSVAASVLLSCAVSKTRVSICFIKSKMRLKAEHFGGGGGEFAIVAVKWELTQGDPWSDGRRARGGSGRHGRRGRGQRSHHGHRHGEPRRWSCCGCGRRRRCGHGKLKMQS